MAKKKTEQVLHRDGWGNVSTAIGTFDRDKRLGADFEADYLTQEELEERWMGDGVASTIVETYPDVMTREGFDLEIDLDGKAPAKPDELKIPEEERFDAAVDAVPDEDSEESNTEAKEISEAICAELEDLEASEKFWTGECYDRAYGGGALLMGANDGQKDLSKPLDEKRLKRIEWLTELTPNELRPASWYTHPRHPKFGKPSRYHLYQSSPGGGIGRRGVIVHETRLIRWDGIKVSRRMTHQLNGWGYSLLERCDAVIRDFNMSWAAAALLIADFSQAVFKVEGLAELIQSNQDDVVVKRARAIDMMRSVARAIMIDKNEEFERKPTPMSGLPETMVQIANGLSLVSRIPVPILMGQAPAGLNATGDSDVRSLYDQGKKFQKRSLQPKWERLVRLLFLCKEGPTGGKEPGNWKLKGRPLWQPSGKELAEERKINAEADCLYVNAGVLHPEEPAQSRFGGRGYGEEIKLNAKVRKEFDAAEGERKAAEEEAAAAQAEAMANGDLPDPGAAGGGKPGGFGKKPFPGKPGGVQTSAPEK